MQYTRDFIPLKECTSGYGRGGMIPHGIARMEYYKDAEKVTGMAADKAADRDTDKNTDSGAVKLRVNIYGLAPGAGPYSVYAIGVTGTTYRRINLGQLQPDALGRCELGYRAALRELDSHHIRVVAVALPDGTEVMTGYVDGAVDWKSLRDAEASAAPEPDMAQHAAESVAVSATAEDAAAESAEESSVPEAMPAESEKPPSAGTPAEPLTRHAAVQEPEDDAAPIASQAAAKDALQYMFQAYPRIYPFRNTESRWIRIHPRDIAPLPADVITLENSPFLQRGYLQFKHLVLGYDGEVYYLGVPFRYHQEQEEVAHNWGFREFRNSFGTVPMKGDYGYWIMPVSFQNEKCA